MKHNPKSASEYLQMFNAKKGAVLAAEECAVQMNKHNPMYFITDMGRIFSMCGGNLHELKQYIRAPERAKHKSGGDNSRKASIRLRIENNTKNYYVHQLVAEYFPIKEMLPTGYKGKTVIHHIEQYDTEQPQYSNRAANLLRTTPAIHICMHSLKRITAEKEVNKPCGAADKAFDGCGNVFIAMREDGKECVAVKLTAEDVRNLCQEILKQLQGGSLI